MAELLILAREPWNNNLDALKMSVDERERFYARTRKGDIIAIRPDGWKWGREECLPRFIIFKVPGVDVKDFEAYTRPVCENKILGDGSIVKIVTESSASRVSIGAVDGCSLLSGGVQTLTKDSALAALTPTTGK